MSRIPRDQPLLPSLLDRLTDQDGLVADPAKQTLRELKESVRRDLENLLNTRRRAVGWSPRFEELDRSLVNYGIPDFTGTNASSSEDLRQFSKTMESVVRIFEPRFKSVSVKLLKNEQEEDRVLRFRIDGILYAEPMPEPAVFDTEMEPATGNFQVKSRSV